MTSTSRVELRTCDAIRHSSCASSIPLSIYVWAILIIYAFSYLQLLLRTRFHLTRGGCQHDLIYTVFRALYTH